jgi:hypothetical protein
VTLTMTIAQPNTATARVTLTYHPAEGADRRWGRVLVDGHWCREYVAKYHPDECGTGRWP